MMSPADYFRLFVICLWLLDGDVRCQKTQKGYVPHVQAGQDPMGVHDDDGDYKRWREPPDVFRIPTAGFKTSHEDGRQSDYMHHFQEDHTTDSKPLNIQNRHLNPVIPGVKSTSFDGKKVHRANFGSVFSSGVVLVPPRQIKLTGGFSPAQVEKAATGFGQNNREAQGYAHSSAAGPNTQDIKSNPKPESSLFFINPSRRLPLHLQELHPSTRPEMFRHHPASAFPNSFNHAGPEVLQKDLKPTETLKAVATAGKVDTLMSRPTWRPRFYGGDVMPGAKGYAHVRHIKPRLDKTRPQAGSAAGSKFLETGFRGDKPGGRRHPPPDRAQTPVQGKFKPFQRLNINSDLPASTPSSDRGSAPPQTSAGTTLPPGLNSTAGTTSSVVPSVTAEMSSRSAPPPQTEGRGSELIPQTSNHEGQSESTAEAGPSSLEQDKPLEVSPPKLKPADKEEKGDVVVSSPPENDQSEA